MYTTHISLTLISYARHLSLTKKKATEIIIIAMMEKNSINTGRRKKKPEKRGKFKQQTRSSIFSKYSHNENACWTFIWKWAISNGFVGYYYSRRTQNINRNAERETRKKKTHFEIVNGELCQKCHTEMICEFIPVALYSFCIVETKTSVNECAFASFWELWKQKSVKRWTAQYHMHTLSNNTAAASPKIYTKTNVNLFTSIHKHRIENVCFNAEKNGRASEMGWDGIEGEKEKITTKKTIEKLNEILPMVPIAVVSALSITNATH